MRLRILLAAALLALFVQPAKTEELQDFVDRLLEASQDAVAPGANHAQHCQKILASSYDITGMARSIAGDAWNKASPAERNAFRAAFEKSTITGCSRLLGIEQGVALAHIGNRDAQGGDKLVGTKWQAQSIDGQAVADPSAMTIDFLQGDHVRGQAGCNRFVGPFASRGDRITLGILRQSRLQCEPAQAAEQKRLIDLLHDATLAALVEGKLVLTGRHGEEIRFVPRPS